MHIIRRNKRTIVVCATTVLVSALALAWAVVPSATAASGACESVVVTVDWDQQRTEKVSGVVVRVGYPASLRMPARGEPASAKDRVELLTGTSGGLFDAVPRDSDHDGRDDVVSVGLITQGIGEGPFARLRFDCAAGTGGAKASDFTCVADVADANGAVPSSCSVALASD